MVDENNSIPETYRLLGILGYHTRGAEQQRILSSPELSL
jgi:hypothetical protein